ncbi:NADPH-dependent FMN reductase [Vibrio sp. UCD-FRSSP16_10]|uniref:NADPH-dependent FMN reductase n=1 Tax=unclassified Vibrio TaxID=2614977 RepID=UPI0007FF985A|nr:MULTISPECIES: NAD(P)H-dependent oxidoreductase [unclassified Vibrio]OBT15880.1 NADPH-dependent FMN reductase [Vibrio sp. UCD-FRSSP16_10]OBT17774.1 NADPH-dependent FMN reductase [Vibrio sp. UCD-FRSSP16_30]
MKIIAFGASTSSSSINKTLAGFAAQQILNADIEVLDLIDFPAPVFSEDTEKELGKSESAQRLLAKIGRADAIIVSFAEHNGSYTAAYKNLFDWATRIERNVFQNKPVLYLATSPGPGGAKTVLASALASAPHFGAQVKGSLSIASFYDAFDVEKNDFKNDELRSQLQQVVADLVEGLV